MCLVAALEHCPGVWSMIDLRRAPALRAHNSPIYLRSNAYS